MHFCYPRKRILFLYEFCNAADANGRIVHRVDAQAVHEGCQLQSPVVQGCVMSRASTSASHLALVKLPKSM